MEDADKKVTVLSFVSPGCRGYKTKSHGGGGAQQRQQILSLLFKHLFGLLVRLDLIYCPQ